MRSRKRTRRTSYHGCIRREHFIAFTINIRTRRGAECVFAVHSAGRHSIDTRINEPKKKRSHINESAVAAICIRALRGMSDVRVIK